MVCSPLLNVAGLVVKLSSQVLKALQPVFVEENFLSSPAHYHVVSRVGDPLPYEVLLSSSISTHTHTYTHLHCHFLPSLAILLLSSLFSLILNLYTPPYSTSCNNIIMHIHVNCTTHIHMQTQIDTHLLSSLIRYSCFSFSATSSPFQASLMSVTSRPSEGTYAGLLLRRSFVWRVWKCVSKLPFSWALGGLVTVAY